MVRGSQESADHWCALSERQGCFRRSSTGHRSCRGRLKVLHECGWKRRGRRRQRCGSVELRSVPRLLHDASIWMAGGIAPSTPEIYASFCSSIIVYFSIVGFLVGYLLTRLFLAEAFRRADQPSVIKEIAPSASYEEDDDRTSERLRNWWKPGGTVDSGREAQLKNWLKSKAIGGTIPSFIYGREKDKRALAVRELNIPDNP